MSAKTKVQLLEIEELDFYFLIDKPPTFNITPLMEMIRSQTKQQTMTKQVDYITRMSLRSDLGKGPIRFSLHSDGDSPKLLTGGRLSFLTVLQGEVDCTFNSSSSTPSSIESSKLVAIDKQMIKDIRCKGETVLLECEAPLRLAELMESTSRVFHTPCSEGVAQSKAVQSWSSMLLDELLDEENREKDYFDQQLDALITLLLKSPRHKLGLLYVPLYAYAWEKNK